MFILSWREERGVLIEKFTIDRLKRSATNMHGDSLLVAFELSVVPEAGAREIDDESSVFKAFICRKRIGRAGLVMIFEEMKEVAFDWFQGLDMVGNSCRVMLH